MANAATLLGLFGTVLGMITAFQELQSAGSQVDPALLSGGIWVALLTTAVGLAVAIPATILYNWLDGIVENCAARMQDSVAQLFTLEAERRSADVVAFGAPHAVKAHAASA
jgi:biopolymer transport protein ExbB